MSKSFTVAYVLTSDGNDNYAKMTIASMLSVRHTNPSLDIVLLMDALTEESLTSEKSFFYDFCQYINRWIMNLKPMPKYANMDHISYLIF